MSKQYIGRVTASVNGQRLESKPGASLDLGGISRNSMVSDQDMGFTEEPKPSRIECEMVLSRGASVDSLRNVTDATLVFECDTGQRYIIKGGYTAETPVITGASGVKLVFMGRPAEEMGS